VYLVWNVCSNYSIPRVLPAIAANMADSIGNVSALLAN
jgi:hypothetical protein